MEFFNPKEDVIDVQLTQYGKYLLSLGKFKPEYYSFHDENIIYDGQCAGIIEEQNNIINRIKNETPTLKTQYTYKGTSLSKQQQYQDQQEKYFSLSAPLGTTGLSSVYQPALYVNLLHGVFTGSLTYVTSSSQTLKIPRMETEVIYKVIVEPDYLEQIQDVDSEFVKLDTIPGINVVDDYLLFNIEELNGDFKNKNFDLEVFMLDSTGSMSPLYFGTKGEFLNDEINPNYVEYFLDIKIDNEIDPSLVCATTQYSSKNVFIDKQNVCVADVEVEPITVATEPEEPTKEC